MNEMNVAKILITSILAAVISGGISFLTNKYYRNRFGEKLFEDRKKMIIAVMTALMSAGASVVFSMYGYGIIHSLCYNVLISGLVMIGVIDRKQMVIPNAILLALLGIRVVGIAGEIIVDGARWNEVLISAVFGVVLGTVIFILIRLFNRSSIGMGDIKLFAIIGLYIGSGSVLQALFITSVFSLIYGVIQIARHTITKKDTMSFGPFIAAGTILVMILGI